MAPDPPAADGSPTLVVRVLGSLEVVAGEARLDPLPARLRRLFAGLVISAGSVVSVDRLAAIVWGEDEAPASFEGALQNLMSRLRSRLRSTPGSVEVLYRPPGYLLALDDESLDAFRFARLAAAGRRELQAAPERAAALLDEALRLWRGSAYAEFADEDFARPEAARLEELRLCAQEDRAEAALRLGHLHEITAALEALVLAEPLRERPHYQLVLAHYRAGRQADALGLARAHRQRLQDELGIDPSPAMQQLETDVLRQAGCLLPPPQPAPPQEAPQPAPPQPAPQQPAPQQPPPAGRTAACAEPEPDAPGRAPSPAARLRLLGREQELAAVQDLVLPGSLVTLTGPGGVGKTSLAVELAADFGSHFADGSVVAELATLSAGAQVAPAVLTVLGVQPRRDLGPVQRLAEYLRSRELLLVLDNCEHVIDAAAALADALHRDCPAVALLATSRSPLDVPDERVWTVPPLSLPPASAADPAAVLAAPAARLFTERATARSRSFLLDAGNAADVAEVCRRLDGLPLAIELAAARMGSLSPAELKDRLSWRFRLLHGGPRTASERHRTLRAVVDWSYDLLEEPSRRIFEVLSVFAGSFPLRAAEQLVDAVSDAGPGAEGSAADGHQADRPEYDVASVVLSLVDRSMLTVATWEPTRYALLETLRAYGRGRLEERGDGERGRRAHAEMYAQLATDAGARLFAPGHVAAVARITAELDELRAAVAWAVEHDLGIAVRLVGAMGIYVEHLIPAEVPRWAERTLTAAEQAGVVDGLAPVYGVAAAGARFAGDLDRGRELALAGLAVAADPATAAYLRFLLSEVALFQGRLDEVRALVAEVASAEPAVPMARMVALIEPLALQYDGDSEAAQRHASELLAEAQRFGEEVTLAWATFIAGEVLVDADPARAGGLLLDALTAARQIGDRYLTGVSLTAAAAMRSRHGDPSEAARLFGDALQHWRDVGDWTHQWTTLRNVIDLLVRSERYADAAVLHGALAAREGATTYGADAVRMEQAAKELESRLGPEVASRLCRQGQRLSDDEVVATATAFLAAGTTA